MPTFHVRVKSNYRDATCSSAQPIQIPRPSLPRPYIQAFFTPNCTMNQSAVGTEGTTQFPPRLFQVWRRTLVQVTLLLTPWAIEQTTQVTIYLVYGFSSHQVLPLLHSSTQTGTLGTIDCQKPPEVSQQNLTGSARVLAMGEGDSDKHTHHPEVSLGTFLLDKPVQLPPTFHQDKEGDSCAWNAQGQDASLQSPCLEGQPPLQPCHDTKATQEPLRVSSSNMENARSSESSLRSMRHCSLEKRGDISQVSSGYAGDEENSEVSLVGSSRIVRLKRRLRTQAGGTPTRQLCTTYCPNQVKSQVASQANSTQQTGGEK
ncbi:protein TNT [Pteronotus mesoamericanus]|uniref:protein TNT n=1 Tax=Pteronotus mesoamericanus TaxID=1884717 RepID=UPI0023EB70ED|nr:protein TNT [Pteronotus parnellii mesoamericanus]